MIVFLICFRLLSMVCLKQQRKMRLRSRRSRTLARRRTAAFREDQEAELRAVASALSADLLLMSSAQRRSVWTRSRSHAFMEVISAWYDLDWKRNFRVNRRTFRYLCNELRVRLHHDSRLRQTITVEKRVAVALWRLPYHPSPCPRYQSTGNSLEYPLPHLILVQRRSSSSYL